MLQIQDGTFYLNGQPTRLYSGCIHYFRVPRAYWEDSLAKLKAAGLNTVETYVCWNLHEPRKGEFDFDGMLDLVEFLRIAQRLGLYAIVRPGPYICAEWDFGGLPAWLLADRNIRLRCMDERYLAHVRDWYRELFSRIGAMQDTRGGNVIAMQIENEYGSYGNDKEYLREIQRLMTECGCEVLMFTADGNWCNMVSGGGLDGVYKTLTFGSNAAGAFGCLQGVQDNAPRMCMEFWDGWFDHWGEKHHVLPARQVVKEIGDFLAHDSSFNLYMFQGGTNFGFWAGANHGGKYQPTTTSYDYNAPLTEWGDYTPLYYELRAKMLAHRGLQESDLPLPPRARLQTVGRVELRDRASLRDNVPRIAQKHRSGAPVSMEDLGQNFGYLVYHTRLQGKYAAQILTFSQIHDVAYVYIDGKFRTRLTRDGKPGLIARIAGGKQAGQGFLLTGDFEKGVDIDILVDCMGRVNYGRDIYDRKGIGDVHFGNMKLFGWDIYTLPMDDLSPLRYDGAAGEAPCFLRGKFRVQSDASCFVHMRGFRKGFVSVNGHNLGRYWEIGPQEALYLPGCWLYTDRDNEIVVFEQEGYREPAVVIDERPNLG